MELLTVREAAAMLRVSQVTLRRYVASGKLPAVRVGRNVRIDRVAVQRTLAASESQAVEELPMPGIIRSRAESIAAIERLVDGMSELNMARVLGYAEGLNDGQRMALARMADDQGKSIP